MLLKVVELSLYFTGLDQEKKNVFFSISTISSIKSYPLTDW